MSAPPAVPVYDSAARPPPVIEELVDLYRYRDLLVELVVTNLKSRYKRSFLGVGWTLLNPIITMMVTTVAFSTVFQHSVRAYPVYVLSGLVLWGFFAQATQVAMHGIVYKGGSVAKRVYLPRAIFPVSAVGTGVVNLLLGLLPLSVIYAFSGAEVTPALLFLPVAMLIVAVFVLGAALCLATIAVFFNDILEIWQAAVGALFFVTPVLYPASAIPGRHGWVLRVNPITYLLETFRAPILTGQLAPARTILISVASALVALGVGWWLFTRNADELVTRT